MNASNKLKGVFATPLLFVGLLKKTKLDNFVGGLIIGAVFSLIVNILTVRTQEVISKQRTLEALEREVTFHILDVSAIFNREKEIATASGEIQENIDGMMARRFSTRVWDNPEVYRYILELNPNASAKLDTYYGIMVKEANRMLEENYKDYQELYEPCRPYYKLRTGKENLSKTYCNTVAQNSLKMHADIADMVINPMKEIKEVFYPTRDRLNSFWLRLLLGNQTVEILR